MNTRLLQKRLLAFYSCWTKYKKDLWGNSDILVICTPPSDSSSLSSSPKTGYQNPISTNFLLWLIGQDLPDTVTIFTQNAIYFLCPRKKQSTLQTLIGPALEYAAHVMVLVYKKEKNDDGLELMDDIIRGIRLRSKVLDDTRPTIIGYVSEECPKSRILWSCSNNLKPKAYQSVSVNSGFSRLLSHAEQPIEEDSRNPFKKKEELEIVKNDEKQPQERATNAHVPPVEFDGKLSMTRKSNYLKGNNLKLIEKKVDVKPLVKISSAAGDYLACKLVSKKFVAIEDKEDKMLAAEQEGKCDASVAGECFGSNFASKDFIWIEDEEKKPVVQKDGKSDQSAVGDCLAGNLASKNFKEAKKKKSDPSTAGTYMALSSSEYYLVSNEDDEDWELIEAADNEGEASSKLLGVCQLEVRE